MWDNLLCPLLSTRAQRLYIVKDRTKPLTLIGRWDVNEFNMAAGVVIRYLTNVGLITVSPTWCACAVCN